MYWDACDNYENNPDQFPEPHDPYLEVNPAVDVWVLRLCTYDLVCYAMAECWRGRDTSLPNHDQLVKAAESGHLPHDVLQVSVCARMQHALIIRQMSASAS